MRAYRTGLVFDAMRYFEKFAGPLERFARLNRRRTAFHGISARWTGNELARTGQRIPRWTLPSLTRYAATDARTWASQLHKKAAPSSASTLTASWLPRPAPRRP